MLGDDHWTAHPEKGTTSHGTINGTSAQDDRRHSVFGLAVRSEPAGALQIVFTLVALIVAGVCRMVAMRLSHPAFTETDGSAVGKKIIQVIAYILMVVCLLACLLGLAAVFAPLIGLA